MRIFKLLAASLLLACSLHAAAQQAPPIQEAMTAEEFRAAGLDKLNREELAALNLWLRRRVGEQTTVAVEQVREQVREEVREEIEQAREAGRQEVVRENRGFFNFGSNEPIVTSIVGEFNGFGRGRRYTLANGQVWEQTDATRLDGIRRTDPGVRIRPGAMGSWSIQIDGYNARARVQRIE